MEFRSSRFRVFEMNMKEITLKDQQFFELSQKFRDIGNETSAKYDPCSFSDS